MPRDKDQEARIDHASLNWPGLAKKSMFGGIGYLLRGNMAFGIWRDHLVVRRGAEAHATCLARPHARPFDITGKAMTGWIMVAPTGFEAGADLDAWLARGRDFAASLPEK